MAPFVASLATCSCAATSSLADGRLLSFSEAVSSFIPGKSSPFLSSCGHLTSTTVNISRDPPIGVVSASFSPSPSFSSGFPARCCCSSSLTSVSLSPHRQPTVSPFGSSPSTPPSPSPLCSLKSTCRLLQKQRNNWRGFAEVHAIQHSSLPPPPPPTTTRHPPQRVARNHRFRPLFFSSSSVTTTRAISEPDSELDAKLERFVQWLIENGAINPTKLVARPARVSSEERIGLIAEKPLSSIDEVFGIPESLCITTETVQSSPMGSLCKGLKPWVQLALFLVYEMQNEDSFWLPYLDILPRRFDSPLFWSADELAELEGSQLLESCLNYDEFLKAEFASVFQDVVQPNPGVFDSDVFTEEAFTWAFGILRSRTHPPFTGEAIALVPLGDLVNHGSNGAGKPTTWEKRSQGLFGKQQVVSMRAGRSYQPGEQIRMDYGKDKSNSVLALEYGFVEPIPELLESAGQPPSSRDGVGGNSGGAGPTNRQTFALTLEINEADEFFDDKEDVANIAGLNGTKLEFALTKGEEPGTEMVAFLRLMALDGPDAFLLEALFRNSVWDHVNLPVSRDNEEAVCRAMIDGCRSSLSGYKTTVDEDRQLLSFRNADLSLQKRMAVIARLGEKQVLLETLEWFEDRLTKLDQLEYYAERRLKNLGLVDDGGQMTPWVFNE